MPPSSFRATQTSWKSRGLLGFLTSWLDCGTSCRAPRWCWSATSSFRLGRQTRLRIPRFLAAFIVVYVFIVFSQPIWSEYIKLGTNSSTEYLVISWRRRAGWCRGKESWLWSYGSRRSSSCGSFRRSLGWMGRWLLIQKRVWQKLEVCWARIASHKLTDSPPQYIEKTAVTQDRSDISCMFARSLQRKRNSTQKDRRIGKRGCLSTHQGYLGYCCIHPYSNVK